MNSIILIVEDHKETCAMLAAAMEDSGFDAHCAGTVKSAKEFLGLNTPCLVILDMHLSDGHGLEVCAWVRNNERLANIPVIALTGQDKLGDKTKGFSAGVDQYLTKPIIMDELVMWVKALLRRVDMDKSGGAVLAIGGLQLDVKAQLVKYKNTPVENLTRREFELLHALVKNSPGILSRKEILAKVWRTVSVENLVDTHLFNLRNKLPRELSEKIQAVAGKGFRYFDKS
ncbi:MAG: response regulator transcription factor [Elusimicrobiota bacterium]|nr:response regulator transcription factor [Elusimicrobiota bacterium]